MKISDLPITESCVDYHLAVRDVAKLLEMPQELSVPEEAMKSHLFLTEYVQNP